MKKKLLPILLLVTLSNIFGIIYFKRDKGTKETKSYISTMQDNAKHLNTQDISNSNLMLLRNEKGLLKEVIRSNSYSLLVLIDPTGCGSCLDENILWNKIQKDKLVNVMVIANHDNYLEVVEYINNSNIRVPVYIDSSYSSIKLFKPSTTPVKILVNSQGNVLLADYVQDTEKGKKLYETSLFQYIN